MIDEPPKYHVDAVFPTTLSSGDTTPIDGNTTSTGRPRSPSHDTSTTDMTATTSHGSGGLTLPAVPVNSPEAQSVAGDCGSSDHNEALDSATLVARLDAMPAVFTPKRASLADSKVAQSKPAAEMEDVKQHTYEHNTWAEIAEEDVVRALARMAMLAKDEHKENDNKHPVSHYYSTRIARLLQAGEIEFDSKYLQ